MSCIYCNKIIQPDEKGIKYNAQYPKEKVFSIHANCFGEFTCLYSLIEYLNTKNPNFISQEFPTCRKNTSIEELILMQNEKNKKKL